MGGEEHTAGLVILPSCIGTLKSTRMRTALSLRVRSVMESFFERDICEPGERKGDGGDVVDPACVFISYRGR